MKWIVGVTAFVLAVALALSIGVSDHATYEIIVGLRLPRVVLAAAVGAGLSIAGTALQALFTNPICEPYTTGVSSGAALGAIVGATLSVDWSWAGVAGTAFVGALTAVGILLLVAQRLDGNRTGLLLSGMMLNFFGSSLVAVWAALADPAGIQGALFWLLGDLSRARLEGAGLVFGVTVLLGGKIWSNSKGLDGFLLGEEGARSIGVESGRFRTEMVFVVSLLVGICVSGAGMIGFVGLVVPHFCRPTVGHFHRRLIPFSALWGGTTLILADLVARTALQPSEIPVGVVTGVVGAPLFLWSLMQKRNSHAVAE